MSLRIWRSALVGEVEQASELSVSDVPNVQAHVQLSLQLASRGLGSTQELDEHRPSPRVESLRNVRRDGYGRAPHLVAQSEVTRKRLPAAQLVDGSCQQPRRLSCLQLLKPGYGAHQISNAE